MGVEDGYGRISNFLWVGLQKEKLFAFRVLGDSLIACLLARFLRWLRAHQVIQWVARGISPADHRPFVFHLL